jgi:hypothetical protein
MMNVAPIKRNLQTLVNVLMNVPPQGFVPECTGVTLKIMFVKGKTQPEAM